VRTHARLYALEPPIFRDRRRQFGEIGFEPMTRTLGALLRKRVCRTPDQRGCHTRETGCRAFAQNAPA